MPSCSFILAFRQDVVFPESSTKQVFFLCFSFYPNVTKVASNSACSENEQRTIYSGTIKAADAND